MSEKTLRKLLERIRNGTPAEALAEFRRLLAAEQPKIQKY